MTTQEKEIKDLKADREALREESQKYLNELVTLRHENKQQKESIKLLKWQIDMIQKAVAIRFE